MRSLQQHEKEREKNQISLRFSSCEKEKDKKEQNPSVWVKHSCLSSPSSCVLFVSFFLDAGFLCLCLNSEPGSKLRKRGNKRISQLMCYAELSVHSFMEKERGKERMQQRRMCTHEQTVYKICVGDSSDFQSFDCDIGWAEHLLPDAQQEESGYFYSWLEK